MSINLNSIIKSALRRIFSRSKYTKIIVQPVLDTVKEVVFEPTKKGGKKRRVYYKCNLCGNKFQRSMVNVDHIIPVVGKEGFVSWDIYITRMFCEQSNLQVLCKTCHDGKTKKEKQDRKQPKNAKKKKK